MKQTRLLAGALMAAAFVVVSTSFGAGYGIYEGSSRGNAMGSEVTADPVSPSVMYNNIAAVTELDGTQFEAGATFIKPQQTVSTVLPNGEKHNNYADSRWWTMPHAYATYQYNEKWWASFGIFSRAGLGAKYKHNWPGRYTVQEVTIMGLDLNPSIAYKVTDWLSLAVGFRAQYFDLELYRAIPSGTPFVDPDLQMHMTGDNWDMGYNLGAYIKATDWLSFGLAFDSEVKHHVAGNYSLSSQMGRLMSGSGSVDMTTPGIIRLGTSVQATDRLKINGGVVYTMWSCYDALQIDISPPVGETTRMRSEKNWHDTFRWQLGVEYALNDNWDLRAGYIHDRTPDPDYTVDYMVPANHRNLFSIGAGFHKGNFLCDIGYTYLLIQDRDVEARPADGLFAGEFLDGDAHMVSVSVGYKL